MGDKMERQFTDTERLSWIIEHGAYGLIDGDRYSETGDDLLVAVRGHIDEAMILDEFIVAVIDDGLQTLFPNVFPVLTEFLNQENNGG